MFNFQYACAKKYQAKNKMLSELLASMESWYQSVKISEKLIHIAKSDLHPLKFININASIYFLVNDFMQLWA